MKVGDCFYYYSDYRLWWGFAGVSFYTYKKYVVVVDHVFWGGTIVDSNGDVWYDGCALINNELVYSHNLKQLELI